MSNNNGNENAGGAAPVEVADPLLVAEAELEFAAGQVRVEEIIKHFRESVAVGEDLTMVMAQFATLMAEDMSPVDVAILAVVAMRMLAGGGERL